MDRNARVAQHTLLLWIHQRISGLTTRKPRHAIIVKFDDDRNYRINAIAGQAWV